MYHSCFIYSSTDRHLGCFQILAIANDTAMNIGMHIFFQIGVSSLFGYIPRSGIAGSKGSSIFNFLRKLYSLFPQQLHQSAFPPTVHEGFLFSPSSPALIVDLFMIVILASVKWYLIVVLIWSSLMINDTQHFVYWPSVCPPWISVYSGPLLIF